MVLGGSAGGPRALAAILAGLPSGFPLPMLGVQHLHPEDDGRLARYLGTLTPLPVSVPCDKEPVLPGRIYVAPANYHLLLEQDRTLALSVDEKVCHSRPSIDVLFESAALALGASLVAVLLSGANHDGAQGMRTVRALGGYTMVQDPQEAEFPTMPRAAVKAGGVREVLPARLLGRRLAELSSSSETWSPEP